MLAQHSQKRIDSIVCVELLNAIFGTCFQIIIHLFLIFIIILFIVTCLIISEEIESFHDRCYEYVIAHE